MRRPSLALTAGSLPIEPGGFAVLVGSPTSVSGDFVRSVEGLHPGDMIVLQIADGEPMSFRVDYRDVLPAGAVLNVSVSHGRQPTVLSLLIEDYDGTDGLGVTALLNDR